MTKLKNSTLFYYSLADVPVMMSIFPSLVFIPRFYASDIGIPLATVGAVILTARIFDVFTDPLMGFVSDRTRGRFGRRRPWVLLSSVFLMVGVYNLYMPPDDAGPVHMLTWMLVTGIGTTMILIPYYAWGAELSRDYYERSRISGWRSAAGVVGQFLAQGIPALALIFWGIGGTATVLEIVGITMLVLMPVCILVTVSFTPDAATEITTRVPIMQGLRLMVTNSAFLRLVIAFMLGHMGLTMTTTLYIFFVADVLGAEAQSILMLSLFYLSNVCSIPFWVRLTGRIEKHWAYLCAFVLISVSNPWYMLLGEGDFWWMTPITILSGIAAGGFSQTLPNAMKADVIDLDTLQSGENRAGLFFAAWSFAQKATASIGAAIAMFGLAWWGFDASPGAVHTDHELLGLRLLFAVAPSILFFASGVLVWKYPITRARQESIRAKLESSQARSIT